MKLILHIGMPKTGTTALQEFLHGNRAHLLKHSILYPKIDISRLNHNFLSLFLREGMDVPRKFSSIYQNDRELMMMDAEKSWLQIKSQVNKYKPSTMILSGEHIFRGFQFGDVSAFRRKIQELTDDINIVLYVRKPSSHYLSVVQQALKASGQLPQPTAISIRSVIEAIERSFSLKPIVVEYSKHKLYKRDISLDFINRVLPEQNLDLDYSFLQTHNESLSAESMAILQDYRAVNHASMENIFTQDSKRLLKLLQKAETSLQLKKPPVLLNEIAQFIDSSSTELLFLANNYGISFNDVDYQSIQDFQLKLNRPINKVSDICDVDNGVKMKILMLVLADATKTRARLPLKLQKWVERKEGNSYVQWFIQLKQRLCNKLL